MEARKVLLGGVAAVALGAGLIGGPPDVRAQTAVQQSAQKLDAASFYAQNAGGVTTCTASNSTVANNTITITPPAGNYVYLTGLYIQVSPANTTGAASAAGFTSTNLTGSPVWLVNEIAWGTTAPALSMFELQEVYPTAIKSTVAGTAVTILPSATLASAIVCLHAVGYYSPL
jgi:hypothetical protein